MNKKFEWKLLVSVVIYTIIMFLLPELLLNIYEDTIDPIMFTIFGNVGCYLLILIFLIILNRKIFVEDFQELRKIKLGKIILYSILGWFFMLQLSLVGSLITTALGGSDSSANQQALTTILLSPNGWIMMIVTIFIGPLVEEVVFRKCVIDFGTKLKVHPYIMIAISAIVFGLIHVISFGDFVQIFPYLAMGIAFGVIYYNTKSVYMSYIVHVMQNGFAVISIFVLDALSEYLEPYLGMFLRLFIR